MTWEAGETVRCTATLGVFTMKGAPLVCSLPYDHPKGGHVYVTGSWVADRHDEDSHNGA